MEIKKTGNNIQMSEKIPVPDGQQGNGVNQRTLSPREQEILGLILDGMSLKEIASKLSLSYKGVDYHRAKLYRKFGIHSMQELLTKDFTDKSSWKRFDIFSQLFLYKDDLGSSVNVMIEDEKIKGKLFSILSIEVTLVDKERSYAGIHLQPDLATRDVMGKATSFSFNILGDGNSWEVFFPTTDTVEKAEGNHYRKQFNTEKDKISVIDVNINELVQSITYGKKAPFIQSNVSGIQFQPFSKRNFTIEHSKLKVWDIRFQS